MKKNIIFSVNYKLALSIIFVANVNFVMAQESTGEPLESNRGGASSSVSMEVDHKSHRYQGEEEYVDELDCEKRQKNDSQGLSNKPKRCKKSD